MDKLASRIPEKMSSQTKTTIRDLIQNCPPVSAEALEQLSRDEALRIHGDQAANRQKSIEKDIGQAGMPRRFVGKRFDDYTTESADQGKAKKICQRYATGFEGVYKDGICLILTGRPGTGKTHLAAAILATIIENKRTGLFLSVSDALRRIRSSFSNDQSEQDVFDSMVKPDLLVLDEVGVSIGNADKIKAMLFDILNARYNDMKPTILLGNLTIEEMGEYLGDRVMDRMKENGGMCVPFSWSSSRK